MRSCGSADPQQQQQQQHQQHQPVDVMSEELDWELSDIFDAGMFAFPVYESSAARRVVTYLLRRGVLAEEVKQAILQLEKTALDRGQTDRISLTHDLIPSELYS